MYDFSHPISDAMENVTHSLCTIEFEDHRPFYDWTIDKLKPTGLIGETTGTVVRPKQIEFTKTSETYGSRNTNRPVRSQVVHRTNGFFRFERTGRITERRKNPEGVQTIAPGSDGMIAVRVRDQMRRNRPGFRSRTNRSN